MRSANFPIFLIMLFVVLFNVSPLGADGDGPERALTSAEKAYFSNLFATIDRSLPPPPAQWKVVVKPSTDPPKTVLQQSEKGAFRSSYRGQWFDTMQAARRDEKIRNYPPPKESDTSAAQQQMESFSKEQGKILDELTNAVRKNDRAGAKAAQQKLESLQKKQQQAMSSTHEGRFVAEMIAPLADACLQVEVTINETDTGLKKASPIGIPGVAKAFKLSDGNSGEKQCPYGRSVVLLGAWDNGAKEGDYTYYRKNWREGLPHPSTKNMLISVRASDERALEYLRKVKWQALIDLIVK